MKVSSIKSPISFTPHRILCFGFIFILLATGLAYAQQACTVVSAEARPDSGNCDCNNCNFSIFYTTNDNTGEHYLSDWPATGICPFSYTLCNSTQEQQVLQKTGDVNVDSVGSWSSTAGFIDFTVTSYYPEFSGGCSCSDPNPYGDGSVYQQGETDTTMEIYVTCAS